MHTVTRTEPTDTAAAPAEIVPVELTINGARHDLRLEPWTSLLDLLREHLQLTGTKKGCDHGQCGACTVLVNGTRINACLALAVALDGAEITTVEGLAPDGELDPMQQAFVDHDALQCGYCTPGQICSALGLLAEGHAHSRDDVREQMSGNLCRCGAYVNITNAVDAVRREQARSRSDDAANAQPRRAAREHAR
jgi:xanthine dehydrogenase YagT iron-sulfur-binding subunit